MLQCVAMCCNVLQCVAVCCSVLQCVACVSVFDLVRGTKSQMCLSARHPTEGFESRVFIEN